jgi:cytochrome c-type biogenesis protein CcmH/NrfG
LTGFDGRLVELLEAPGRQSRPEWPAPGPEDEVQEEEFEAPEESVPDVGQARAMLTEPRPAGFGEVLVTEVWLPPEAEEAAEEVVIDRQRAWETRQELRELNLLRERPLVVHDARSETYWDEVREARQLALRAIIDPYTELATAFCGVELTKIREHREEAREYGRGAAALVELGRAYVVIGRLRSARSVFRAAALGEPHDPEAWWGLGVSHLFARANAEAVKALRQAADQSPGEFRCEMALGLAHYHRKDYAAAEEVFRRQAGGQGMRATVRSLLACSLRMQEKWEQARVELGLLRHSEDPADWAALTQQCLDCVDRGEQKREGPVRTRRRARQMWKSLATAAIGAIWIAYAAAEDLFRKETPWATLPLFVLGLVLARALRGITGRELPGEFGNAEQGLPCWQATAWMRPRRSEF